MMLQTVHLHRWTQLCICIVSDIFIFDCPYKIGTECDASTAHYNVGLFNNYAGFLI